MSARLRPWKGRFCWVWPVMVDDRSFVWVEEEGSDGVGYAVLYHRYRGLWYRVESFVLRDPYPHPAEVEPLYGEIERVGYTCN
jgi:hypothetical protein